MEFDESSQRFAINAKDISDRLDPRQSRILKSLFELNPDLAEIYAGALSILSIDGQRDRMALSAHGIRELMEKIPEFLSVPMNSSKEKMQNKVNNLQDKFHPIVNDFTIGEESFENDDGAKAQEKLTGREGHVGRIVGELREFFTWFSNHHPKRRKVISDFVQKMDQGYIIPDRDHERRIQIWMDTRDYFVGVAHHRKISNSDEFHVRLYTLEAQLFNYLCPEPFEDQDILDQIIEEAESAYQD